MAGATAQHLEPGNELSFDLTLIGRAQEYFPYFVVALREIDRLGRRNSYLAPTERPARGSGRGSLTGRDASAPGPTMPADLWPRVRLKTIL